MVRWIDGIDRLLVWLGIFIVATIIFCLLIGLSGCTIRYVQPIRTDTLRVYLNDRDQSVALSHANLQALHLRMLRGDLTGFNAYQVAKGQLITQLYNEYKERIRRLKKNDAQEIFLGQYSEGPDSFIVRYLYEFGKVDTVTYIPAGDSWIEQQ